MNQSDAVNLSMDGLNNEKRPNGEPQSEILSNQLMLFLTVEGGTQEDGISRLSQETTSIEFKR